MLKMVIFDLDGVLLDACDWHRDALNASLKEVCNYEISLADHYTTFNGIPTRVKLKRLTEMGILPEEEHERVYNLKQKKTIDIIQENAAPRPEKIALMKWLKEHSVRVSCFTNSIRETAYLMLEKTGIKEDLALIITNQDVEHPKPHPEGYKKVLDHFNIAPEDAIIVEDSPKGKKAAYAAGCAVLEVENAEQVNIKVLKEFIDENFNTHGW